MLLEFTIGNFLRYMTLVSKSKATQQDIEELAREINEELAHLNKEFIH